MDIAKEKQSILDYVAGLQDSVVVQDLKNFIESRKISSYHFTESELSLLEESKSQYLKGEYKSAEEANSEIREWLDVQ